MAIMVVVQRRYTAAACRVEAHREEESSRETVSTSPKMGSWFCSWAETCKSGEAPRHVPKHPPARCQSSWSATPTVDQVLHSVSLRNALASNTLISKHITLQLQGERRSAPTATTQGVQHQLRERIQG